MDRAKGAQIRSEVLGTPHVQGMATNADPFYQNFIDFTEEFCWGNVWVRPGLERKTRSMLNLAMLSVMARWHEFEIHVRGALNNGVSKEEIAEILLQAGVYGGVPIAAEGFRAARRVFEAVESEKKPASERRS